MTLYPIDLYKKFFDHINELLQCYVMIVGGHPPEYLSDIKLRHWNQKVNTEPDHFHEVQRAEVLLHHVECGTFLILELLPAIKVEYTL